MVLLPTAMHSTPCQATDLDFFSFREHRSEVWGRIVANVYADLFALLWPGRLREIT